MRRRGRELSRADQHPGGDLSEAGFSERQLVSERISDAANEHSWPDASSWYWSALRRQTRGPWWAVTVVESMER